METSVLAHSHRISEMNAIRNRFSERDIEWFVVNLQWPNYKKCVWCHWCEWEVDLYSIIIGVPNFNKRNMIEDAICVHCKVNSEHWTIKQKSRCSCFWGFGAMWIALTTLDSKSKEKNSKHIQRIMRAAFFHLHCCGRTMRFHMYWLLVLFSELCTHAALTPLNDARLASPDYIWYTYASLMFVACVLFSCSSSSSSFSLFICSSLDCGFS